MNRFEKKIKEEDNAEAQRALRFSENTRQGLQRPCLVKRFVLEPQIGLWFMAFVILGEPDGKADVFGRGGNGYGFEIPG